MQNKNWQSQKVYGRDKVLLDIERRANAYSTTVVQDVRAVMHDYEVDMYRLVMGIGKRYGMDTAYEIMSDTVTEKRLKWLYQVMDDLVHTGSELDQGLGLYLKYFQPKEADFLIVEQSAEKVVFKRKDFINAISYACEVLGLSIIEVNNKVYARAMNLMFQKACLNLRHEFIAYQDDWYVEVIENA